jgi:hypothetical protein
LGAAVIVRDIAVEFVRPPDVPVTVIENVPVVAVLLAVRVSVVEEVAGFGLNEAVTPLGSPEAEKLTSPVKPFWGVMVIVLVPLIPCVMLRLVGDAERAKSPGTVTVTLIAVVFVRLPDVPVMVTGTVPVVAVLLAVSVRVVEAVSGFGLNEAVTPLGSPEAEKFTSPVKPFWGVMVIVLVPLDP